MEDSKLPLPAFLKMLTTNNIPIPKAMFIAQKIYKDYHTSAKLAEVTEGKLTAAGIENKEDRKLILNAIRKAGYGHKGKSLRTKVGGAHEPGVSPQQTTTTTKTKRKRTTSKGDVNEFLPNGIPDESEFGGNYEFNEILDEDILRTKSTVVNRAPLMTAWSMMVAQRLNFAREEALSIASVYTELNAVSKGISLGLFDKNIKRGREAMQQGSQPYVELLGRSPLYRSLNGQWRALSNGSPVPPSTAFTYVYNSLRQTTPYIVGALKLLADSYEPEELNTRGWSLYAEFRPVVDEWGKKSEVKCKTILDLRKIKQARQKTIPNKAPPVKAALLEHGEEMDAGEPANKKLRTMTLEEYEAALDEDTTFDNVDLDASVVDR